MAAKLFIFFFLTYILTGGGHLYSLDEEKLFLVTKSMVEERSFQLEDGNFSCYGLGPSFLAIPFYAAGKLISVFMPKLTPLEITRGICSTFNSFVTALTCLTLFKLWQAFSVSARAAFLSTLLYGFGTLAWPYSKYFFPQPLAGLCLLGTVSGLFRFGLNEDKAWLWKAGFWMGLLFFSRFEGILFFPLALSYIHFKSRKKKDLILFSVWPAVFLAFELIYNYIRSGHFYTGYGASLNDYAAPLWLGLYGNLISAGKGIIIYMPAILIPAIGFKFFKFVAERRLILITSIVYLILYSKWWDWSGDWAWGPRLLVAIMPIFFIPAPFLLAKIKGRSLGGGLILALSIISILVTLISLPISFNEYLRTAYRRPAVKYNFLNREIEIRPHHFVPGLSPLIAQVRIIKERFTILNRREKPTSHDYYGREVKMPLFDFWYVNLWEKAPSLRKPLILFLAFILSLWILILSLIFRMIKYDNSDKGRRRLCV